MGKIIRIELDANDLGQLRGGLEVRAKAWEDTARYRLTGESPDELFVMEDCDDATEAERVAAHYRSILTTIERQIEAQGGW